MRHPDLAIVASGLCIVAASYGLARYAYGLFLPSFHDALQLSDAALAAIAASSYAAYVLVAVLAVPLIARLGPRMAVALVASAQARGSPMAAGGRRQRRRGVAGAGLGPGG